MPSLTCKFSVVDAPTKKWWRHFVFSKNQLLRFGRFVQKDSSLTGKNATSVSVYTLAMKTSLGSHAFSNCFPFAISCINYFAVEENMCNAAFWTETSFLPKIFGYKCQKQTIRLKRKTHMQEIYNWWFFPDLAPCFQYFGHLWNQGCYQMAAYCHVIQHKRLFL